jgi:Tol biopolymer transport system component
MSSESAEPRRRNQIVVVAAGMLVALVIVGSALSTTHGPNGRILYQQEANGRSQLFTVRPDGTGRRQLTHGPTESVNGAWSPDGKSIVFERSDDSHAGVMIMSADGSNVRDLTPTGYQGDPTFTPDGRQIVFTRTDMDRYDAVFVMNIDGSGQRELRVTRNRVRDGKCGCDVDATVSPDGRTITYVRVLGDFGTNQALMSVRRDGTGLKRLTPPSFEPGIKHDWSPDGKWILFSSPGDPAPGQSGNLWLMRPDGSHRKALTHFTGGAANAYSGSFSPDGKWIVFRKEDRNGYHLSRIRPDGSGFQVITSSRTVPQRASAWGSGR